MDRISDANGIVWLFLGIILYCLLTVVFTLGVWVNSEKISKISYLANVIATVIISLFNIGIVFASVSYESDYFNNRWISIIFLSGSD